MLRQRGDDGINDRAGGRHGQGHFGDRVPQREEDRPRPRPARQLGPLALALARHPRLLVLDEPTAPLDPVARHDFMATVVTAMTDDGVSVVLSSHALAELERVADYLVLLVGGAVRVRGVVDDLLQQHLLVTGRGVPDQNKPTRMA